MSEVDSNVGEAQAIGHHEQILELREDDPVVTPEDTSNSTTYGVLEMGECATRDSISTLDSGEVTEDNSSTSRQEIMEDTEEKERTKDHNPAVLLQSEEIPSSSNNFLAGFSKWYSPQLEASSVLGGKKTLNSRKSNSPKVAAASATDSDEKCPICLVIPIANKSYTDGCQHEFCYVCILEWSKVKAECPLCKKTFKSIVHDVKSTDDFQKYEVPPPAPPPRFRYRTTMTGERYELLREIRRLQTEIMLSQARHVNYRNSSYDDSHSRSLGSSSSKISTGYPPRSLGARLSRLEEQRRLLYPSEVLAPSERDLRMIRRDQEQYNRRRQMEHDLHRFRRLYQESVQQPRERLLESPDFRRLVYARRLRVRSLEENNRDAAFHRVRDVTPAFFKENPAVIHRLVEWLTRELSILLNNNMDQVRHVTEQICGLLTRYDIRSVEMRRRLVKVLFDNTELFQREFYHFARSPCETMVEYDGQCHYSAPENPPNDDPHHEVLNVDLVDNDEEPEPSNAQDPSEGRRRPRAMSLFPPMLRNFAAAMRHNRVNPFNSMEDQILRLGGMENAETSEQPPANQRSLLDFLQNAPVFESFNPGGGSSATNQGASSWSANNVAGSSLAPIQFGIQSSMRPKRRRIDLPFTNALYRTPEEISAAVVEQQQESLIVVDDDAPVVDLTSESTPTLQQLNATPITLGSHDGNVSDETRERQEAVTPPLIAQEDNNQQGNSEPNQLSSLVKTRSQAILNKLLRHERDSRERARNMKRAMTVVVTDRPGCSSSDTSDSEDGANQPGPSWRQYNDHKKRTKRRKTITIPSSSDSDSSFQRRSTMLDSPVLNPTSSTTTSAHTTHQPENGRSTFESSILPDFLRMGYRRFAPPLHDDAQLYHLNLASGSGDIFGNNIEAVKPVQVGSSHIQPQLPDDVLRVASSDDDEGDIQVVCELPPKHLRTPPLVTLEDDTLIVEDITGNITANIPQEHGRIKAEAVAAEPAQGQEATLDPNYFAKSPSPSGHRKHKHKHHKKHKKHGKKRKHKERKGFPDDDAVSSSTLNESDRSYSHANKYWRNESKRRAASAESRDPRIESRDRGQNGEVSKFSKSKSPETSRARRPEEDERPVEDEPYWYSRRGGRERREERAESSRHASSICSKYRD